MLFVRILVGAVFSFVGERLYYAPAVLLLFVLLLRPFSGVSAALWHQLIRLFVLFCTQPSDSSPASALSRLFRAPPEALPFASAFSGSFRAPSDALPFTTAAAALPFGEAPRYQPRAVRIAYIATGRCAKKRKKYILAKFPNHIRSSMKYTLQGQAVDL